jgi:hypothetical protein
MLEMLPYGPYGVRICIDLANATENSSCTTFQATMCDVFSDTVVLDSLKNEKNNMFSMHHGKSKQIVGVRHQQPRLDLNFVAYGDFFL